MSTDKPNDTTIRDKNGRECLPGDVIRVYHYQARNGRKCYLYKLVVRCSNDLEITKADTPQLVVVHDGLRVIGQFVLRREDLL